jgi:hypothetical protein
VHAKGYEIMWAGSDPPDGVGLINRVNCDWERRSRWMPMCAGAVLSLPRTHFLTRWPAFLCGAPDKFSLTNPITSSKKDCGPLNEGALFGKSQDSHCLIEEPAKHSTRPQGVCAEQFLYTGRNRTLATIKHVSNDREYLVPQ